MRRRVFSVYFRQFLQRYFAYRVDAVFWVVNGLIWPVIMLSLWTKIAEAKPNLGMSQNDLTVYFILTTLVSRLTQTWTAERIAERIKDGRFSQTLLKPLSYAVEDFSHCLSTKLLRLICLAPFLVLLIVIFRDKFRLTAGLFEWILFFMACVLGFFIRYGFERVFAGLAFFVTETEGADAIWTSLTRLIDGDIIPLVLLPTGLFLFAKLFYTRFIISFPLEIILGQVRGWDIVAGFIIGLAWIGGFMILEKIVWTRGIKKYTAVGM